GDYRPRAELHRFLLQHHSTLRKLAFDVVGDGLVDADSLTFDDGVAGAAVSAVGRKFAGQKRRHPSSVVAIDRIRSVLGDIVVDALHHEQIRAVTFLLEGPENRPELEVCLTASWEPLLWHRAVWRLEPDEPRGLRGQRLRRLLHAQRRRSARPA